MEGGHAGSARGEVSSPCVHTSITWRTFSPHGRDVWLNFPVLLQQPHAGIRCQSAGDPEYVCYSPAHIGDCCSRVRMPLDLVTRARARVCLPLQLLERIRCQSPGHRVPTRGTRRLTTQPVRSFAHADARRASSRRRGGACS
jgi:hypothetical protein